MSNNSIEKIPMINGRRSEVWFIEHTLHKEGFNTLKAFKKHRLSTQTILFWTTFYLTFKTRWTSSIGRYEMTQASWIFQSFSLLATMRP